MNYTAVLKILKKHDKVTRSKCEPIMTIASSKAVTQGFMEYIGVNDLLAGTKVHATAFTESNLALARKSV